MGSSNLVEHGQLVIRSTLNIFEGQLLESDVVLEKFPDSTGTHRCNAATRRTF